MKQNLSRTATWPFLAGDSVAVACHSFLKPWSYPASRCKHNQFYVKKKSNFTPLIFNISPACHFTLYPDFFWKKYLMENAENAISEPLYFTIFWGRMSPHPLQPLVSGTRFQAPPRSSPIENTLHCPCLTHPFSHNSCYIHNLFHIFFIRNRRNLFKVYCAHFVHFYLNSFQEIFCCQTVWTTAYLTLF